MKRRKEGLRNRLCPNKNSCLGYEWTVCDDCEIGNLISSQNTKIVNQRAKINHLKKENTLLRKLSNRLILTRGIRAKITKNHIEIVKKIEAENTALRLAVRTAAQNVFIALTRRARTTTVFVTMMAIVWTA